MYEVLQRKTNEGLQAQGQDNINQDFLPCVEQLTNRFMGAWTYSIRC